MPDNPLITLTTDFGYEDPFVGVMKGVILKINPRPTIIDLTHGIRPRDIQEAAFFIGTSYRFFPDDTIHVVVVDPGVGSRRRPIMVMADNHYFIGPDNGVFSYVYSMRPDMLQVIHITAEHYFLSSHSPTFQGRDIFAPVAAWFSRGVSMWKFGEPITDYQKISLSVPQIAPDGSLEGEVVHIDRFGNAITNITKADIEKLAGMRPDSVPIILFGEKPAPLKHFYSEADAGTLSSLVNSSDYIELFVYRGSASSEYKISAGAGVRIRLA